MKRHGSMVVDQLYVESGFIQLGGLDDDHDRDTNWEDLRVSLFTSKLPAANYPNLAQVKDDGNGSTGVFGYHFDDGEYVNITVQMPHSWKAGSTIYPHIHWLPTTDESQDYYFKVGLEYLWSGIGGFDRVSTIITRDIKVQANTGYKHMVSDISATGISGTGKGISSVLLCRLYRAAADGDNYASQIVITDFDIHYRMDTMGSREILSK